MSEISMSNFGLVVAYLLPGFTMLWGLNDIEPTLQPWLVCQSESGPTVGGFMFVTMASIGLGVILSTVRWLLIDSLHHHSGLPKPHWDFAVLPGRLREFEVLNEQHYRYYQFYGNMVVSLVAILILLTWESGFERSGMQLLLVFVTAVLFIGSRDALRQYYRRVSALMG